MTHVPSSYYLVTDKDGIRGKFWSSDEAEAFARSLCKGESPVGFCEYQGAKARHFLPRDLETPMAARCAHWTGMLCFWHIKILSCDSGILENMPDSFDGQAVQYAVFFSPLPNRESKTLLGKYRSIRDARERLRQEFENRYPNAGSYRDPLFHECWIRGVIGDSMIA